MHPRLSLRDGSWKIRSTPFTGSNETGRSRVNRSPTSNAWFSSGNVTNTSLETAVFVDRVLERLETVDLLIRPLAMPQEHAEGCQRSRAVPRSSCSTRPRASSSQLPGQGDKLGPLLRVTFAALNLLTRDHPLRLPGALELRHHHRFVELRHGPEDLLHTRAAADGRLHPPVRLVHEPPIRRPSAARSVRGDKNTTMVVNMDSVT